MSVEELALNLPTAEKIQLMEVLWADLSKGDSLEAPNWHEPVLADTEKRYLDGKEEAVDWTEAKRRLRAQ